METVFYGAIEGGFVQSRRQICIRRKMLAHQLDISPNGGQCCYTLVKQLTQLSFPKCIVLIHDFIQITSFSWNTTGERYDRREIGHDGGRGKAKAILEAQQEQPEQLVVWDNVQFHHVALVRAWIENHPHLVIVFLPANFPFLNSVVE